jgi:hypothetical protein
LCNIEFDQIVITPKALYQSAHYYPLHNANDHSKNHDFTTWQYVYRSDGAALRGPESVSGTCNLMSLARDYQKPDFSDENAEEPVEEGDGDQ